jgi:hypothetical protein
MQQVRRRVKRAGVFEVGTSLQTKDDQTTQFSDSAAIQRKVWKIASNALA